VSKSSSGLVLHSGAWDFTLRPHPFDKTTHDKAPNLIVDVRRENVLVASFFATETYAWGLQIVTNTLSLEQALRGRAGTLAGPNSWLVLRDARATFRESENLPHLGVERVELRPC
jgi:hypothetical protein